MKGFKLYFYDNNNNPILFSSFIEGENYNSITFDENLEENENDQFNLSFSIMKDIFNLPFDIYTYLRVGRKLKLECDNHEDLNYIDFIISFISPEEYNNNIKYNINAIDYASFIFSRNNIGLNFDSINDEEWLELLDNKTYVNNLAGLGNYILERTNLQNNSIGWTIEYTEKNENKIKEWILRYSGREIFWVNGPELSVFVGNFDNTIVFTPYETVKEDYQQGTYIPVRGDSLEVSISVERGETLILTENIFIETTSTNSNLNDTYYIELYKIVYYPDGNLVFHFVDDNNLDKNVYFDVDVSELNLIDRKFNISLSDSNTYNALIEIANLTNTIFKISYSTKTIYYYDKNEDIFYKNYQLSPNFNIQNFGLEYSGEEFYSILYVEGGEDDYGLNVGLTPTIPEFFYNADWETIRDFLQSDLESKDYYSDIWLEEWGEEDYNLTNIINKTPYLDNFLLDLDYFKNNSLLDGSQYDILFNLIYNDLRKINVKFQNIIRKKYEMSYDIFKKENSINNYCEILVKGESSEFETYDQKIRDIFYDSDGNYDYFLNIMNYGGLNLINEKIDYYKNELIYYINLRDDAIIESNIIKHQRDAILDTESNEYLSLNTKYQNILQDIEDYKLLCGTWKYNKTSLNFLNSSDGTSEKGKFGYILDYYNEYYDSFVPTDIPHETLLERYENIKNQKKLLWYQIKRDYGQFLIEGYYKNDIEVDPTNLYNQALLYFQDYKQPQDSYNITYLDISNIIGKEIDKISVGDYIQIKDYQFDLIQQLNNEIRVTAISRSLRDSSNISLTVDRIKNTKKILEQLLLGIK